MEKTTKQLIDQYQVRAKKKFGQNFLMDQNIIEKIVKSSQINKESIVIEVGPGLGALTRVLSKNAKEVIAYEIDQDLVEFLPEILADFDNVKVINQDFLEVDLVESLKDYATEDLVVCANLPYYITTPILFKIFESEKCISKISVMMQREVADRFTALPKTKDYNALSVISQYKYQVSMIVKVPKTVFYPAPNVDSAVVLFVRKEKNDDYNETEFFNLVKACFKQRRKTIYNNLKLYISDSDKLKEILEQCQIPTNTRSEELSLKQFTELFESYRKIV